MGLRVEGGSFLQVALRESSWQLLGTLGCPAEASMFQPSSLSRALARQTVVVSAVILLWAGYTVFQTLFVLGYFGDMASALLGK